MGSEAVFDAEMMGFIRSMIQLELAMIVSFICLLTGLACLSATKKMIAKLRNSEPRQEKNENEG